MPFTGNSYPFKTHWYSAIPMAAKRTLFTFEHIQNGKNWHYIEWFSLNTHHLFHSFCLTCARITFLAFRSQNVHSAGIQLRISHVNSNRLEIQLAIFLFFALFDLEMFVSFFLLLLLFFLVVFVICCCRHRWANNWEKFLYFCTFTPSKCDGFKLADG